MKCKKCGYKLIEEYLGEKNKEFTMCSPCLIKQELKMEKEIMLDKIWTERMINVKRSIRLMDREDEKLK